jgi:hypothetical protein
MTCGSTDELDAYIVPICGRPADNEAHIDTAHRDAIGVAERQLNLAVARNRKVVPPAHSLLVLIGPHAVIVVQSLAIRLGRYNTGMGRDRRIDHCAIDQDHNGKKRDHARKNVPTSQMAAGIEMRGPGGRWG